MADERAYTFARIAQGERYWKHKDRINAGYQICHVTGCYEDPTHGVYCERHHALRVANQEKRRAKDAEYRRKRKAEFRAKGLCPLCGKVPVPGMIRCEYHQEQSNEYAKTLREKKCKKHD